MNKPEKYTADKGEILKQIKTLAEKGMTVAEACEKKGLTQPTYYRWRRELNIENNDEARPASKAAEDIMDAAMELFAENGLNTSLREISRKAEVSVGTINYHFKSTNDLFYHIAERGVISFRGERYRLLKSATNRVAKPKLVDIINAFYMPALEGLLSKDKKIIIFNKFLRRLIQTTDYQIQAIVHRCFQESHNEFLDAFSKALPKLSETELYWRYIAFTGVYFSITQNPVRVDMITNGKLKLKTAEKAMQELMPILIAIMKA